MDHGYYIQAVFNCNLRCRYREIKDNGVGRGGNIYGVVLESGMEVEEAWGARPLQPLLTDTSHDRHFDGYVQSEFRSRGLPKEFLIIKHREIGNENPFNNQKRYNQRNLKLNLHRWKLH